MKENPLNIFSNILNSIFLQPWHHGPEFFPDLLDLVLVLLSLKSIKHRSVRPALQHEFSGELAALYPAKRLFHRLAGLLVDNFRTDRKAAVFSGIGHIITQPFSSLLLFYCDY